MKVVRPDQKAADPSSTVGVVWGEQLGAHTSEGCPQRGAVGRLEQRDVGGHLTPQL